MRFFLAPAAVVVVGLAVFEATMQPSGAERLQLAVVFAVMAATGAGLVVALPRVAEQFRSLRSTVVMVAVAALGLVVASALLAGSLMFLTVHDLTLLVVVLAFGTLLGVGVAVALSRRLEADLESIQGAAALVSRGDLTARTSVSRRDELGSAAAAFDSMVKRLETNEKARRAFLAAVGHDLRTPLAALRAAVEALEDGVAVDPDRYLRSLRADLDAISHLVDDLLLLATIEAGRVTVSSEPVDLAELADESIEALAPVAAQRAVTVRLDTTGSVPASGAPGELGRVIRNLLDNAIRHAPAGTEVVVSVRNGQDAIVVVTDDGPGFPNDLVRSVFESFVTGDPARSREKAGAGLGLAIAKAFVTAHGGEIWAEPGPGGRVGFRLPALR